MKHRRCILQSITVACAMAFLSQPGWALEPVKNKPILTLTGKIDAKNNGDKAEFDLAMLEALPQKTFTTQTPWEDKPIKFTGPLLRDVLAAAKAQGTSLKAIALNDYKISIPMSDTKQFDVVVAHRMNDQLIPVRTKGPLFIIYPFDSAAELRNNTYYGRSIWQLKAIEVD